MKHTQIYLQIISSHLMSLKAYVFLLRYLCKKQKLNYSVIRLATRERKITLLRSPHVHKKSKQQFLLKKHKILFNIDTDSISLNKILVYAIRKKLKNINLVVRLN